MHQMQSLFVDGDLLDFTPTKQEDLDFTLQALTLGGPKLLVKDTKRKVPNLSILNRSSFFTKIC